jgi:hypothetical protein
VVDVGDDVGAWVALGAVVLAGVGGVEPPDPSVGIGDGAGADVFDGLAVFDGFDGFAGLDGESVGRDVGAGSGCTGAGRIGSGVGAGVGGICVGTEVEVAVGAAATTATTGWRVGVLAGTDVFVGELGGGGSVGSTAAGTGICSATSV